MAAREPGRVLCMYIDIIIHFKGPDMASVSCRISLDRRTWCTHALSRQLKVARIRQDANSIMMLMMCVPDQLSLLLHQKEAQITRLVMHDVMWWSSSDVVK